MRCGLLRVMPQELSTICPPRSCRRYLAERKCECSSNCSSEMQLRQVAQQAEERRRSRRRCEDAKSSLLSFLADAGRGAGSLAGHRGDRARYRAPSRPVSGRRQHSQVECDCGTNANGFSSPRSEADGQPVTPMEELDKVADLLPSAMIGPHRSGHGRATANTR